MGTPKSEAAPFLSDGKQWLLGSCPFTGFLSPALAGHGRRVPGARQGPGSPPTPHRPCQEVRTALNFQGAVLLVQGVPPQVHHAGRGGRDSGTEQTTEQGKSARGAAVAMTTGRKRLQGRRACREGVSAARLHVNCTASIPYDSLPASQLKGGGGGMHKREGGEREQCR